MHYAVVVGRIVLVLLVLGVQRFVRSVAAFFVACVGLGEGFNHDLGMPVAFVFAEPFVFLLCFFHVFFPPVLVACQVPGVMTENKPPGCLV